MRTLHRFRDDRCGTIAVWFGVMLVPLLLMAGAGLDMMRAVQLRAELQAAADAAALAGAAIYSSASASTNAQATATRYMTAAIGRLPGNSGATFTVTPAASGASVYSVTVQAQASLPNSIMALISAATAVSVTAQAQGASYGLSFALSSFASNAADADSIYWYVVPPSGGVPDASALNLLFSNTTPNAPKNLSAVIGTGQKIGFALKNVTGGISGYGRNGYGGAQGSTHLFYSHLNPPSSAAYGLQLFNCSLRTTTSTGLLGTGCSLGAVSYGTLDCAQAAGKTITYKWNDMGGVSDDYDYNDAVYTVTCSGGGSGSGGGGGGGAAGGVVLVK